MPNVCRWMIGYGVLLLVCSVVGGEIPSLYPLSAGLLMIAAGLACAQGRRSLRLSGYFIGIPLPLVVGGFTAFRAIQEWRLASIGTATALGFIALVSFVIEGMILRLRPRHGIASRGYAVPLPPAKQPPDVIEQEPIRRSEAG